MNFHKIWRLWLKNCARHAHFNFELLKGVAASFFELYPSNFSQAWIFYRKVYEIYMYHIFVSLSDYLLLCTSNFDFLGRQKMNCRESSDTHAGKAVRRSEPCLRSYEKKFTSIGRRESIPQPHISLI